MAIKWKRYDARISIQSYNITPILDLDLISDSWIKLSIHIKCWHTITKRYNKTELRLQKIEELLGILKWD